MSKPVEEGRQAALTDEEKLDGALQVSDHKGHSVEYDGVIYPSLSALAREKHISYGAMYRRLRMGMDLEQALQSNQRNHTIEYDGKIYPSIKALAEEQQRVYSTLKARLERGMRVEEALLINNRLPSRKRRSVEYAGKMYPSIRSLAIERRIPYQTLRTRLCRGMTVEEALSASGPSIEYGGKTYLSVKSLADELHVPYCRLRHRLKKGMAVDEALQNNRRLRKGMTIEEALDANKADHNIDISKPTTGRAEPIPANAEDAFGAQDEGDINTEDEADEAAFIQTM